MVGIFKEVWKVGKRTDWGMAFVPLFAPSLSAMPVVLSGILDVFWVFGACVLLMPGIWSERGPVDFIIDLIISKNRVCRLRIRVHRVGGYIC
jgi:hypothetical protein